MNCPDCNGKGHVMREHYAGREFGWQWLTFACCETCRGCGVAHCCEGHQPDAAELARLADDGNPHVKEGP